MESHAEQSQHAQPVRPRAVMIVGAGRSGTNWLLDIFDQSPDTFCRNEPNEIPDGAMADLPSPILSPCALREADWDRAIECIRTVMGQRDHRSLPSKAFVHEPLRRAGGVRLLLRPRMRRILSGVAPSLRRGEWLPPRWLMSRHKLRDALLVMKFAQAPGWASWVLENRSQIHVVHIVRHPGGFLSSWHRRYLAGKDEARVRSLNAARLRGIVARQPEWGDRLGAIDEMTVDESELWYWCYASQVIHDAGSTRPNYTLVTYEQLATNPVARARELYRRCGLEWNPGLERKLLARSGGSKSISQAWRTRLSEQQTELVERIFRNTSLRTFWSNVPEDSIA